MRTCGVLMPVSSLDGAYGTGSFGREAYRFVDFLQTAGQGIWQILPLGPVGVGNSPYQSCSAFAGNLWLVDPELLAREGLVEEEELAALKVPNGGRVDHTALRATRMELLQGAYRRFLARRPLPGCDTPYPDDYYRFLFLNSGWLEDYCLYRTIKKETGGLPWAQWPAPLRRREPGALAAFKEVHREELGFWEFGQYIFWKQWSALKAYANQKGVQILGDMPIYISADSADAWAGGELFQTDAEGRPSRVSGCPPDYFAKDGQLWGNPLYAWGRHKATGYAWWCRRIRHSLALYDQVRIDHFRAFDTYWAIPAGAATAKEGTWEKGPGMDFFDTLTAKLGKAPLVAEDLGLLFDSVRQLLKDTGLPGMKVLQFAFSGPDNGYLPHNHIPNCIVYTGTHDNNTLRGWVEEDALPEERAFARAYTGAESDEALPQALLRLALGSCADTCILPLADWLGIGGEGRINTPGTVEGNWGWRVAPRALGPALAARMRALCGVFGRCTAPAAEAPEPPGKAAEGEAPTKP